MIFKSCVVGFISPGESSFAKFHTKSHLWRFAPNTGKTKAKWSHFGPKSSKCTFGTKNPFWAQKRILGPKCVVGPKSDSWGAKCDFEQNFTFGALTNSHTPNRNRLRARPEPKLRMLLQKCIDSTKFGIFALFATLGPKGRLLRKSALLRPHAADAYKTNGK